MLLWPLVLLSCLLSHSVSIALVKSSFGSPGKFTFIDDQLLSIDSVFFHSFIGSSCYLIGACYYVAGSYPHAKQFYYKLDRGQYDEEVSPELYLDELGEGNQRDRNRLVLPDLNIFDGPLVGGMDHQSILKHHVPHQDVNIGNSESKPNLAGNNDIVNPLHRNNTDERIPMKLTPTHIYDN